MDLNLTGEVDITRSLEQHRGTDGDTIYAVPTSDLEYGESDNVPENPKIGDGTEYRD